MSLLGEEGLRRLARLNHANAVRLADRVSALDGVDLLTDRFFNEFAVRLPGDAAAAVAALAERGILGGVPASRLYPEEDTLSDVLLLAATETNTDEDIDALVDGLKEVLA